MKKGVFLVHGFLRSGEKTFGIMLEDLKNIENIDFLAVDLQGHSESEDINTFNHKKCIIKVVNQYKRFKAKYDEVILVGFSMGGVIASYLASKYKCDKLILVAPAFKYIQNTGLSKDILELLSKKQISRLKSAINRRHKEKDMDQLIKEKFKDEFTFFPDILSKNHSDLTIIPFREFIFLVEKLKKDINIKDIPVRIYIGENDEIVPLNSALYVFKRIKSDKKRLIVLPNIHHMVFKSSLKNDLKEEIIEYIVEK